jgi:hypothetical protein
MLAGDSLLADVITPDDIGAGCGLLPGSYCCGYGGGGGAAAPNGDVRDGSGL